MKMSSPISAFSMYNSNKEKNKSKKKLRAERKALSVENIPIETILKVGQKLKEKEKKVKSKKKALKTSAKSDKTKSKTFAKLKNNTLTNVIPQITPLVYANINKSVDIINQSIFDPVQTDSVEEGRKLFKWLIAPYSVDEFFEKNWERKPLHISRKKNTYYKALISTPIIDDMIRKENIVYSKNIDITSYTDGKRETHNPVGRAHPHVVWDYYLNGCSIRLLNPQTYISQVHLLNATIQEFTNSFVGANAYLTPPDSQGFAPHYDDIEAFILQIEGKKHWRIYKPLSKNEILPRVSSRNFNQDEIGNPILEVTLEAGDMLYFPRGYIHQAVTVEGEHSLHITISMYQKHSWADLFEKILPNALQIAIDNEVDLRKGLPFDIYEHFGMISTDADNPRREEIGNIIKSLFYKIINYLPLDAAVDEMSKHFQRDALPPVLTDLEKDVTVYGDSYLMMPDGKVTRRVEIDLDTKVRLLRRNILRLVMDGTLRLYYYTENSMEYHGNEMQHLEIEEGWASAVGMLTSAYPEYVSVEDLDIEKDDDKVNFVTTLWEKGLLMAELPLPDIEDD